MGERPDRQVASGLARSAAGAVRWSAVEMAGTRLLTFAVFLVLARLLTPEAFGVVALASVFVAVAQVFLEQGLGDALVQRRQLDDAHIHTAFWVNVGLSLVAAGACIAASPLIARAFGVQELGPVLSVLSTMFVLGALSAVPQALLRRDLRFRPLAVRSMAAGAAGGLCGVAAAVAGAGVWSLVTQQVVAGAAGVVVLWRATTFRPRFTVSAHHMRQLLGFGSAVFGTNVVITIYRRADDVLIGKFLGASALGVYSVGYRLLLVMTDILTGTIFQVALPTFSRLQGDTERLKRAFYRATEASSLLAFPVFAASFVLAPELIVTLFGAKWSASVPVFRALCLVGLLHSVMYFNSTVLLALGRARVRFWLFFLHAIVNVAGFAVAVNHGVTAVAISYACSTWLLMPLDLHVLRRALPFSWAAYGRNLAPSVIGSGTLVAAAVASKLALRGLPASLTLVVAGLAGVAGYLLAVSRVRPGVLTDVVALLRPAKAGGTVA